MLRPTHAHSVFSASVVLMAVAGSGTGLMALLIGPLLYRVLDPHAVETRIKLYTDPLFHHTIYLDQIVPSYFHNVFNIVAFAVLAAFITKGLCDYCANYLVNYVGFSAVTNLRNRVFDKVVRQGAEFLFIITNDAWFYATPGTYQHAAMASLRAIERRRYVVQAANSGVSMIIDPYGRMIGETKVFDQTKLYGPIYPENEMTPYTRFGDVIVWLCLAFAVAALTAFVISGRKQPRPAVPEPAPKNETPQKKKSKKR